MNDQPRETRSTRTESTTNERHVPAEYPLAVERDGRGFIISGPGIDPPMKTVPEVDFHINARWLRYAEGRIEELERALNEVRSELAHGPTANMDWIERVIDRALVAPEPPL